MPGAGNSLGIPLLTVIIALPAVAGAICWIIEEIELQRRIAAAATIVDLALAVFLLIKFETNPGGSPHWMFQFADKHEWVSSIGINYWVGVDGVSVFLVGLTTLIVAIAVLASNFMIADRTPMFLVLTLFLETAILGVFTSINVFLFFVFWEAMLIPSYFLVGIWGEERRAYATIKFVGYTMAGSFLMLVGIFYLWAQNGTLDMPGTSGLIAHPVSPSAQTWLFLAFGLAFAIKLPLFPFHTWAPTVYTESPVPVAIMVAGILSKAGAFGFLRYCLPLFPHGAQQFAGIIAVLAVVGMLYAAGLALVQTDIKRLVAYASISHMNLIVFGIFALNATGFDGAVLQMINHSVIITGLFLAVAYITARTGTRFLTDMGGLGSRWPVLMWLFFVFVLAGLDLPGLGSFAGEFLILAGAFRYNAWYSAVAALVAIMAAWYMIRFFQQTMNGPSVASPQSVAETAEDETATAYQYPVRRRLIPDDLLPREIRLWVPLLLLVLYLGVQPDTLTTRMNATTNAVQSIVHSTLAGVGGGGR
jgi:NADH-quinone oxidoreductase subunit M